MQRDDSRLQRRINERGEKILVQSSARDNFDKLFVPSDGDDSPIHAKRAKGVVSYFFRSKDLNCVSSMSFVQEFQLYEYKKNHQRPSEGIRAIPSRQARAVMHLPKPAGYLPILGNTVLVARVQLSGRFHDWALNNCPFEDVQKTQYEAFGKNPLFVEAATDVLGQGLFAISGPLWHHQRKTASRLFSAQMIQHNMNNVVLEKCRGLMKRLDAAAQDDNKSVSLKWILDLFTMDVFCQIGFGIEMDGLDRKQIIAMLEALQRSSARIVGRILEPSWCWKLRRYVNIGAERQFATDMKRVNGMLYGFIARSIQDKANRDLNENEKGNDTSCMDLISLYLEQCAIDNGKDVPFQPKKLRDFLVSFLAAGQDTTATAMSWFVVMMNRYPKVLEKVRREIRAKKLQSERLSVCTSVHMPHYTMARMKSVWGSDAENFKPERWIDPMTEKLLAVSAFKFSAFYGGPHSCLGMKFAMSEIKITLAALLSRYDFKTTKDPFDYTYRMALSLGIDGGLDVYTTRATNQFLAKVESERQNCWGRGDDNSACRRHFTYHFKIVDVHDLWSIKTDILCYNCHIPMIQTTV
ncbi:Cytochrome P450, E-class, group I [Plasmopara halstedii]|uniref:Cytochrome P450, E-class, group I n=1 Tax=Plasmopara halstedii TaxID=4781 RepID=A0A0P1AMJ4_PLAHL|nr:Cytochrome P450, E-class, group I [Plasmopara halstedii]CEG42175.1 Cytochrome P450, E-class, group I [Plasmopara halstedii]|eukprot:XP_024578544.1 Cytochrome P450, E-class, group I [Plasmopara halstedii]